MTLADSHVKALLKEGTARFGNPPSGTDWRMSPDAISEAKRKAEDYLRKLGEDAARHAAGAKRSTLRGEDVSEPAPSEAPVSEPSGGTFL